MLIYINVSLSFWQVTLMIKCSLMGMIRVNQYNQIIDQKLNKPNCKLEDLMEEDLFLQEIKNPSSKIHNL